MTWLCDEKRSKKREVKDRAHGRWVAANKEKYLAIKRQYAARPETLARRRRVYHAQVKKYSQGEPKVTTLDAWAKKDDANVQCDSRSDVDTNRY